MSELSTTEATHELHGPCGEDERVTVAALVADVELDVQWTHGWGRRTYRLPTDEAPDTGGHVYGPTDHSWLQDEETVTLVEIPCTTWGDYCGDIVQRANYVAILETHADDVVDVSWGMGGHSLALRLDGTVSSVLRDELRGLVDYPVICEDTLGTLESELESEDWEGFARDDIRRDAERKLDELRDEHELSDADVEVTPEELDELRDELRQNGDALDYVTETATGGYFTDTDVVVDRVVTAHVERARVGWENYARSILRCDGQLALI